MKVEEHAVVLIHYVLTNDDKEVLDSSEGQEPLAYLHGTGHLIPGLEAQLLGKVAGETLHFAVDIIEVREATAEELEHGHVH